VTTLPAPDALTAMHAGRPRVRVLDDLDPAGAGVGAARLVLA
jgi:hypothetical protein